MTLDWRIRRLQDDWGNHSNLSMRAVNPLGTIYRVLTTASDERRDATMVELRMVAKLLDDLDRLIDERIYALVSLRKQVIEFQDAVNEALENAEPLPAAEPPAGTNGIDDEVVDRLAAFYNARGHRL